MLKETEVDAEALIEEYVEMYKSLDQGGVSKEISRLEKLIETTQKKKQKLLTFNAMGELSDQDFLAMNKQCTKEIESATKELAELSAQRDSAADFKKHIDTVRRVLADARRDAASGLIGKEFVEQYIDKIFAAVEEDGSMRLQVKIFTGETTDKYLQNLRSRTGHTFKKMIESYENGMQ